MVIREYVIMGIILCLCGAIAGCTSAAIGTISYDPSGKLLIHATNDEGDTQAVLQITIYQIQNFTQTEILKKADFVKFNTGSNDYIIPVHLESGTYKIYIYIIVDGDSKARVVRDLVV